MLENKNKVFTRDDLIRILWVLLPGIYKNNLTAKTINDVTILAEQLETTPCNYVKGCKLKK